MADGKLLKKLMGRVATPFGLSVAIGDIVDVQPAGRFGRIDGVDANDPPTDVWNGSGIYTGHPIGAAEELEIRSSDINDAEAGTGARTVRLIRPLGLDKELLEDVVVTLDGTNWVDVNPGQVYERVSKAEVLTVGSGGSNAGAITIRHKVTVANIFALMPIGHSLTAIMCDTVPAGYTLYSRRWHIAMSRASGAAGSANVSIRARKNVADAPFVAVKDPEITQADSYDTGEGSFIVFTEKTDFKVSVDSVSDNVTQVYAEHAGYLIKNSALNT